LAETFAGGPRTALLFDLDGTLTSTDHLHFDAFGVLLRPFGRSISRAEYDEVVIGRANAAIMLTLFPDLAPDEHRRLADEKEAIFRRLAVGGMTATPGLSDLLGRAAGEGMATAVVTNAPRANAELMLAALGLADRFDALVIGDELAHGKPHPLPYLTALERVGVPVERAVAFEDSPSGIASACAAGLPVFGLTTGLPAATLTKAGATAAIADFTDPRVAGFLDGMASEPR
jgi:beta-phosphoglucomutase